MAYRIYNKDDSIGYYTGEGWDTDASKAIHYASEEIGLNIVTRHNMNADVEEVKDAETDKHTHKRKG